MLGLGILAALCWLNVAWFWIKYPCGKCKILTKHLHSLQFIVASSFCSQLIMYENWRYLYSINPKYLTQKGVFLSLRNLNFGLKLFGNDWIHVKRIFIQICYTRDVCRWSVRIVACCWLLVILIDVWFLQLLKRVFDIMREKNPDMVAGEKKRIIMKPPQVMRVGTKKSSFSNFVEICKMYVQLALFCCKVHWFCSGN